MWKKKTLSCKSVFNLFQMCSSKTLAHAMTFDPQTCQCKWACVCVWACLCVCVRQLNNWNSSESALKGQVKSSASVNRGNERTLCNVVCGVCMCIPMGWVCACVCVCVDVSSCVCLRAYVKDSGEKKVWFRGGEEKHWRKRKQSTLRADSALLLLQPVCSCFLCIYCHVSLSLIKLSTILFTSACVPMAPVVFVQPKRAWSNHFLLSFYLLFYFKFISFSVCFF